MGDTLGKDKKCIQDLCRETQANKPYETSKYVCMYTRVRVCLFILYTYMHVPSHTHYNPMT
jgi:hypothetical protein